MATVEPRDPAAGHAAPAQGRPPRPVLVVGADDAAALQALFDATTYAPTLVDDVAAAEHHLRELLFHAVVVDVTASSAPAELVRRLIEHAAGLPVVAVFAAGNDALVHQSLDAGVHDVVRRGELTAVTLTRALELAAARARAAELARRLEIAEHHATLGAISAYVAHEVNNHAAVLLANTTLLHADLAELRPRAAGEDAERIDAAVTRLGECAQTIERIGQTVSQLKALGRATPGAPRVTDVARVVERTVQVMNSRLRHSAVVTLSLEPCPPAAIEEDKLAQVVVHLLRNAAEAVSGDPATDRITVRLRPVDGGVRLSVADTGVGIPDEDLARMFRPFYSSKPEGAGLGLAITAEIVRAAGGRISAASADGVGSTFTVTLPAAAPRAAAVPATPAPRRVRRRVLLVDDDTVLTKALAMCLKPHHEIVVASGGEDALVLLERTPRFDVILCDLMMPGVDGVALYAAVRDRHPESAPGFAILSGGAFTPATAQFIESNQVTVIAKPVPVEALLEAVDRLAARPR